MAKGKKDDLIDQEGNQVKEGVDILAKIWNFFSSMKLGIILLIIIAALSILGTIIPQNAPEQEYNQSLVGIYKMFGLINLYGTWYFKLLLFLLSFNLLICSLNRWKLISSALKGPNLKVSPAFLKKLKSFKSVSKKATADEAGTAVQSILKSKGYRLFSAKDGENVYIAADKARFGVLGSLITHIAFIVILIGGIIGSYFGFSSFIYGRQDGTFNVSEVQNLKNVSEKDYFDVAVDKFWIEFNPDGSPKDYFSKLRVLDKGQVKAEKTIEVNAPLKYKGVTFYQSSWLYADPLSIKIIDRKKKTEKEINNVQLGQEFNIPNSKTSIRIFTFVPHYSPDYGTQSVSNFPNNPTMFYEVWEDGQKLDIKTISLKETAEFDEGALQFTGYSTYTGLQVKKDPGVWVVWIGSGLLVLGMTISFLLPHRKIWAVVAPNPKGATVEIGGLTQKNKIGFEKEYNEIINSL